MGGPALAADAVEALENGVVGIALLLQIHARGQAGRAAADDADARVLVHSFPPVKFLVLERPCFTLNFYVKYTTKARNIALYNCRRNVKF